MQKLFFDKVAEMRDAQQKFFRTRSHLAMQRAKSLEKEIDVEIKRVKAKMKTEEKNAF